MTITCYALDAVTGAPVYSGKLARVSLGALSGGKNTARPLGAFSGVTAGTPDDTCSISGTTWTVKPHTGLLDLHTAADAGPYMYAVTANETGSINAAHSTHPRIDILSIKINDPAESDGSSVPEAVITYTAGTAAASPTQPSTPTRSMLLATINVPQSGGGSASLSFVAPRTAAAGGIFPVRNTTERAALTTHAGASAHRPLYVHRANATAGEELQVTTDGSTFDPVSRNAPVSVADHTTVAHRAGRFVYNTTSGLLYLSDGTNWHLVPVALPYCEFRRSTNQSISNASTTVVDWDASPSVKRGTWTESAGAITIPETRTYAIDVTLTLDSTSGVRFVRVTKGGTADGNSVKAVYIPASLQSELNLSLMRQFTAGDVIRVQVYQASGGALNLAEYNSQPGLIIRALA